MQSCRRCRPVLSKDQIEKLLVLLARVKIRGEEAPAFIELVNALNAQLRALAAEPKPE